jgi:hypothetical protein
MDVFLRLFHFTKECFAILNISQFSVLLFLTMWGFLQGLKHYVFVNHFFVFLGSPAAGLTESLILGTVLGKPLLNLKSLKGQYSRESKIFFKFFFVPRVKIKHKNGCILIYM